MLYLFDCDGVLIDSEIVAAEVDSEHLTAFGYEITPEEVIHRFAGATIKTIVETVEEEIGRSLPDDFIDNQKQEVNRRLREEVDPVDGVHEMLDALDGPRCVCSNSSSERLRFTLEKTQLYTRFEPHIFSATEVGNEQPKPDPNVFLFAAEQLGVDPADTVVLEDSSFGIAAAQAAGMRVVGFTGGAHTWTAHADALTDAGAETIINRIIDFPTTAAALLSWRREAI